MAPHVAIIILNWNGWKDTIECLESVLQINYPNYEIILVDNGSEDESIKMIKGHFNGKVYEKSGSLSLESNKNSKQIEILECAREETESNEMKIVAVKNLSTKKILFLIKNERNYGFAEGNNIAIRFALKIPNVEYLLQLNNDTVVDHEFLKELVNVAESDVNVGVVGAVNYYYDHPEKIWFAGGKINFWNGKISKIGENGKQEMSNEADYVAGSCILIKKEVIEKVGMLDKAYFAYWEDTDWCIRVHKANYRVLYVPKAKIWHKVSSTAKKINGFSEYYETRNTFLFIKKNCTWIQYVSFLLYFFGFKFWLTNGQLLICQKNASALLNFYKGIKDGLLYIAEDDKIW